MDDGPSELNQGRRKVVEGYLEMIGATYHSLSGDLQLRMMQDLGTLCNKWLSISEKGYTPENPMNYDGARAKAIREEAGLSSRELAKILNVSHSLIHDMEGEERRDLNPNRRKFREPTLRYLRWLKEQGYNPFNL